MNQTIFVLTTAFLVTFSTQASAFLTYTPQDKKTVGLSAGAQFWQNKNDGRFSKESILIDFYDKKSQQVSLFVAVEHPFPILPNIRVSSSHFDTSHLTNSTENFSFTDVQSGLSYDSVIDSEINYRFNVSYIDYTLYYKLLADRLFSLDLGFTARDFSGSSHVDRNVTTVTTWKDASGNPDTFTHNDKSTDIITPDNIEPMLYLASEIYLPLKGVSLFAKGDFLLKSDNTISDYQAGLGYALLNNQMISVNAALGYRVVKMEFENSTNLSNAVEVKGAFISFSTQF